MKALLDHISYVIHIYRKNAEVTSETSYKTTESKKSHYTVAHYFDTC